MIINQVVAGSGGGSSVAEPYINWTLDSDGKMVASSHLVDLTGVKEIPQYCFYQTYINNTTISGAVDFSDVKVIDSNAMFSMLSMCTGIISLDLSGVERIFGSGLYGVTEGCSNLENIDLRSYKTAIGIMQLTNAFQRTKLVTAQFQSLSNTTSQGFQNCFMNTTTLQSIWFYALTDTSFNNCFNNMLSGVTGCTVHFPMVVQSTMSSWTSVTGGFGGTNTTVLFDLVTSLTGADSNTYTRSEKDSTPTATAWKYNSTLYYTSGVSNNTAGVNEPSVGDTIYSDDACTTSVTTITAIA